MNTFDKLLKSWWVILSFIFFLNGFGFIYIGARHSNRNWIIEGAIYEIPWFFYFIYFAKYGLDTVINNPTAHVMYLALLLQLVCIIRAFWVAAKLWGVYDNFDKYAHNPVELKNPHKANEKDSLSNGAICCLCIAVIFFMFALMAII